MEPAYGSELFERLAVAFAIGLLIGLERGWQGRRQEEGWRMAGIRTFGLIGLLGGLSALLGERYGDPVLAFAFVGFAGLIIAAQLRRAGPAHDYGITTAVAALLTFVLGSTAVAGYQVVSASVAVLATVLLGTKPELHAWLEKLEKHELLATFKLLLISVVLLPVLPNRAYGPWGALNPYEIWWLVVLIAAIGFAGYFSMKLAGARTGAILTGLFGGLASSTVVALSFGRLGRRNSDLHPLLAAGVVIAATTMFPRMLVEIAVVNAELLPQTTPAALSMLAVGMVATAWLWRSGRDHQHPRGGLDLPNPFELGPALKFAALLVTILLLSRALVEWVGDRGVYPLAVLSGIADVDAITLSLARLARGELDSTVAARAIIIAAMTNTAAKGMLVAFLARGLLGRRVSVAFGATIAAGALALWLTPG